MGPETMVFACDNRRSSAQLIGTLGAYFAIWALYLALPSAGWIGLALVSLATGALCIRVFNIQHDCSHHSYFSVRRANEIVGSLLGIVTLTPFHYWRAKHLEHHRTSGDLDRRGTGDITTLTVDEYLARGAFGRWSYRLYRHPAFFLVVGPLYYFLFSLRAPGNASRSRSEILGIVLLNAALLALFIGMAFAYPDPLRFFSAYVLSVLVAGAIGLWLFFIQHQFEGVVWVRSSEWRFREAGMTASSHLVLPRWLEWFVLTINQHDTHHLHPSVPNYKLRDKTLADAARIDAGENRVSLKQAMSVFSLKLWDEEKREMVGFPRLAGPKGATTGVNFLPPVYPAADSPDDAATVSPTRPSSRARPGTHASGFWSP